MTTLNEVSIALFACAVIYMVYRWFDFKMVALDYKMAVLNAKLADMTTKMEMHVNDVNTLRTCVSEDIQGIRATVSEVNCEVERVQRVSHEMFQIVEEETSGSETQLTNMHTQLTNMQTQLDNLAIAFKKQQKQHNRETVAIPILKRGTLERFNVKRNAEDFVIDVTRLPCEISQLHKLRTLTATSAVETECFVNESVVELSIEVVTPPLWKCFPKLETLTIDACTTNTEALIRNLIKYPCAIQTLHVNDDSDDLKDYCNKHGIRLKRLGEEEEEEEEEDEEDVASFKIEGVQYYRSINTNTVYDANRKAVGTFCLVTRTVTFDEDEEDGENDEEEEE